MAIDAIPTDMPVVNIPTLKDMARHCARNRKSFMIWGQPGVGKSEVVKQLAWEDYLSDFSEEEAAEIAIKGNPPNLIDIRLSQYDSVDLRGFPGVNKETLQTHWYSPSTMPFKGNPLFEGIRGKRKYLFLDEMNSASIPTLAVAYQLTLDRRVGEHELMDDVVVIAAANREGDRGVTNRMPKPLANRFTHAEVAVDPDAFVDHLIDIKAPAIFIAFYKFRKNLITTFDPSRPDKSYSTPRSIVDAIKIFMDKHTSDDIKRHLIGGTIGVGPATELYGFFDVWKKMIPIEKILADPMGVPLPDELSAKYAVTISVSGHMKPDDPVTKEKGNTAALAAFLGRLEPEFNVLAWTVACKRNNKLCYTPEFIKFSEVYGAVFS